MAGPHALDEVAGLVDIDGTIEPHAVVELLVFQDLLLTFRTLEQTLERLHRYVDAGADCVFVPGALDPATIAVITSAIDAPLNVLPSPTLTRKDFASLGVARISTGSLPYRAALTQEVAAGHRRPRRTATPPGHLV